MSVPQKQEVRRPYVSSGVRKALDVADRGLYRAELRYPEEKKNRQFQSAEVRTLAIRTIISREDTDSADSLFRYSVTCRRSQCRSL